MDAQKTIVSIPCPLHPSENVQRVALDPDAEQHLFCLECVIQNNDQSSRPTTLRTIKDFINVAATYYDQNRNVITPTSQVPSEYLDLLSTQSEYLEKMSAHLEEEKKTVERIFAQITESVMQVINQKKTECLYSLDQQLCNLRYWYIFFDKLVKKAHPTEEDIVHLFPTKDELINKIQKISNATQLTAFVRNIKEDLNEKRLDEVRGGKRVLLDQLYTRLKQLINESPRFEEEGLQEVSNFKSNFEEFLADKIEKILVLSHPIVDVQQRDFPSSKIVTQNDFKVLKGWLPKEFSKFNPKLIYRGTRDGLNGQAFHDHCDGKGATITVIKANFNQTNEIHHIGGFLDLDWHQTGAAICSNKAFIFSLTNKVRCFVISSLEAAYGVAGQGPLFGAGYDIGVTFQKNYCLTCSYQNFSQLFMKENQSFNQDDGVEYFTVLEIEVYTVK